MTIPNLQCPVANFGYEWALGEMIQSEVNGQQRSLLDVGCRDSGFPAWAAKCGYDVTACELDPKFLRKQSEWKEVFNVDFDMYAIDLRSISTKQFDVSTSFCAIQHSAENDVECYQHLARITRRQIFITTEFDPKGWRIERGRDDGDMRIYDPVDLSNRIFEPIANIWGKHPIVTVRWVRFDHPSQQIEFVAYNTMANMIFIKIER